MIFKLRIKANARRAVVPPPVSSREISGEANPVPSFGRPGGATYMDVIPSPGRTVNVGRYTPPPKNPIWTRIPEGMCKEC